jgi:hypothetical protein
MPAILADSDNDLPEPMRMLLSRLLAQLRALDQQDRTAQG